MGELLYQGYEKLVKTLLEVDPMGLRAALLRELIAQLELIDPRLQQRKLELMAYQESNHVAHR